MNRGIYLLSIAGFSILTSEFLIVGLLPGIATDLEVSISTAGILVTLFSVAIVASGPFLTAALSRVSRKWLLVAIMAVFAMSNGLAAIADNYITMAVARLIPAVFLPVFWGMADAAAVDLAGPAKAGRAVAIVTLGAALGSVLGVPLGVIVGEIFGWRAGFGILAGLCLLKTAMLVALPECDGNSEDHGFAQQLALLKDPFLVLNTVLSALVFCSMFTAYTYMADILATLANLDGDWIGWTMMAFGGVGLAGNYLGGKAVDTAPMGATIVFIAILATGIVVTVAMADLTIGLVIGLAAWGIAQAALTVICSVRMIKSAMSTPAFAASLNVMGANVGIAVGAFAGGQAIEVAGLASIGWASAGFAMLSALLAGVLAGAAKRANVDDTTPA